MSHRIARLRAGSIAVVALLVLAAGTSTAQAALTLPLPGPLGSGPTKPAPTTSPTTLTGLVQQTIGATGSLLTNQIGLGTFGETVACPVAKTLSELAPPGSPGVDQATFTACVLHFLDFEWRTSHPGGAPTGTDDRVVTTMGVPAPLNLDADHLPEAVGTVLALAPNQFQLGFRRTDGGIKGDLPATAELVISDPTGESFDTEHIAVGLDSNGGRFPDSMALTFTLESFQPPLDFGGPPRFRIDIDSTTQPKRAALTAEMFDEDDAGTVRDSFMRGELGLKPLPAKLSTTVTMREDRGIDVDVTRVSRTTVTTQLLNLLRLTLQAGPDYGAPTLDADVVMRAKPDDDGARKVQHLTAELERLPTFMGVKYRPIAPSTPPSGATREQEDKAQGGQTMTYAASSVIPRLDVTYDDVLQPAGSAPEEPFLRARARIRDIPTGISFSQLGSFTNFDAVDGGIGSTEAEFALNGELVERRTPRPGVRFLRSEAPAAGEPEPLALAARIDGVRRVAFDTLDGRAVADVGIAEQPFDIDLRDDVGGITATAAIENLPANAHIEYLPAQPASDETASGGEEPLRVRYDAGDHAIGLIRFNVAFDETVGDYLDEIKGHIKQLPPVIDVTADLDGEVYEFNATKPFGEIEATARNQMAMDDELDPVLTAGSTGVSAVLRDSGLFAAKGRVVGLKNVKADLGLNKYHVEAGAVPFEARALVDEVRGSGPSREVLAREMLATIDKLPSTVDVQFDEGGDLEKTVTYEASDRIGEIALQLTGDKLFEPQPKVNKVRATVLDVPKTMTLGLGNAGKLDLTAGDPMDPNDAIGGIEALITSGPDPAFAGTRHQAYVETGENVVVKALLLGFKRFKLTPDPIDVLFQTAKSLPLEVDAKLDLDDPADGVAESEATLDIVNVPSLIEAAVNDDGSYSYDGSERIQSIDVTAKGLPQLPDDPVAIHSVAASIDGVPKHLDAGFGDDNRVFFKGTKDDNSLDNVDSIEASAATANPPALPTGLAASHVAFRKVGSEAAARVKVSGLREIDVTPAPLDAVVDTDVLSALDVDAAIDDDANSLFEKTLTAKLRSNITRVTVKDQLAASGRKIIADTGTPLGTLDVDLKADNLPLGISTVGVDVVDLPERAEIGFPSGTDVIEAKLLRRDGNGDLVKDNEGVDLIDVSVNGGEPRRQIVNRHGATVPSDGAMVDLDGGNITKAALEVRGFRGFTYGTSPYTKVGLDVNQTQAQPVALDATMDDKFANGHIDKLPSNMLIELSPQGDQPIHYSADQRISEIELATNFTKGLSPLDGAQVTVQDVPTDFRVCFRTDGVKASCLRPNRFDARTDRLLSAAYTSNVTTTGTRPSIFVKGCFDSETCSSGKVVTLDADISRRIELEAGASANGPTVRSFDCFDDTSIDTIVGDIGCAIAYPVNALTDALTSARAGGFLHFDTGSQNLDANITYTLIPAGGIVTEPVTLHVQVPTLNATDAYLEAELSLKAISEGAVFGAGGSMTCSGGRVGIKGRFGHDLGTLDLPDALVDFVNGIVDAYNAIPEVDDLPHVQDPVDLGAIDVPIDWNLIGRIC